MLFEAFAHFGEISFMWCIHTCTLLRLPHRNRFSPVINVDRLKRFRDREGQMRPAADAAGEAEATTTKLRQILPTPPLRRSVAGAWTVSSSGLLTTLSAAHSGLTQDVPN